MACCSFPSFYQWNHVSIVFSDDEYGTRGLHELEQLAPNASLCIAEKLKLPTDSDPAHLVMLEGSMFYTNMVQKLLAAKTDGNFPNHVIIQVLLIEREAFRAQCIRWTQTRTV